MRASLSYKYQEVTSSLMVFSIMFITCSFVLFGYVSSTFLMLVEMVSFLIFIFSFAVYSYLRCVVVCDDYIKCNALRATIMKVVLFINIFTCVSLAIAMIYIHFISLISFTQ